MIRFLFVISVALNFVLFALWKFEQWKQGKVRAKLRYVCEILAGKFDFYG